MKTVCSRMKTMFFWMKKYCSEWNSVEGKPCINREINILDITIYLYRCYDEHEAPRSCNTTLYLSEWVNIVVIASGQYMFACRNNVLDLSVRVWIFISSMAFWWCYPTPQSIIVWLSSSISDMIGCSENLPFSAWYL